MTDERGWQTTDAAEMVRAWERGLEIEVLERAEGGPSRGALRVEKVSPGSFWAAPTAADARYAWLEAGGFILAGPGATVTWREA